MNITDQINSLNQSQLIEAALTLSNFLTTKKNNEIIQIVEDNPSQFINEVDELSRIILINAYDNNELKESVQEIIRVSGKKNVILSGLEIIALAALAVAALKIILNPVEGEEIIIKDKDGNVIKKKKTYNSDVSFLSSIFKSLF